MAPRKRRIEDIQRLAEPPLTPELTAYIREGGVLFNRGAWWHAHEAWESAWLRMPEGPAGDAEIVVRGLIQLAAALHLEGIGRQDGAASNLRKAVEKLALAPDHFLGIDIGALRSSIARRVLAGNAPPSIVFID